jgi:cobalt-zinc-cadmium resistance protein CzcA
MLNRLVELSLRYKFLVLIVFGVVAFLGARAVRDVPIDAFPDVTPAQVNIYTESPGLAAEDVEQLLTFPVESAMAGLPKVQEIRSVSLFGLSYVSVYFEDDMEIYFARQLVNERLQEVGDRLPEGYGKPSMGPNSSGLGQVFWYTVERAPGVSEEQISDMDLRTWQDWTLRLILRTAPGVDDVTSWGGGEREYQVRIDPQRLYARGLGFGDVINALPANNGQVGGNVMDVGREQYLVRGLGLLNSAEDIGGIVLKAEDGVPVYVRDIGRVIESPAPRFGAVTRDGEEVVLGMALSRIGENAKNVVEAVKAKLAAVSSALPDGMVVKPIYERTDLVNKAVGTATSALLEGSILVAVILFLFLGELRSALVVIVTLPLAMLIAFIGMEQFGLSANLMSLAGLAIGIGMMVDGSVVMVENAFRIMAERKAHGETVDRTSAVLAAQGLLLIVQRNTTGPVPPVCVKVEEPLAALLKVPVPPLTTLHAPVPVVGVLPPSAVVVPRLQMVCVPPTVAVVGGALTVITTSLVEAVQGLFVAVQRKVRAPAVVRPVMVVVGEEGVVIVAAVPATWDQEPAPEVMVLAAIVTVPVVVQIVCAEPALAVVGF